MSTYTFIAQTKDLCRALAAAAPFANEKIPGFGTVRLFIDDTNTYVGATNGSAMGLALASTLVLTAANEHGEEINPGLFEVDLLPTQARAIVTLFKAGATDDADEEGPGAELRIDVDDHEVTVTDASGLLEGQSLTLPRPPTADNAAAVIIATEIRNSEGARPSKDQPPRYYGPSLALVLKAEKVYGHPLVFEHKAPSNDSSSGTTLIRCGESFLAVIRDSLSTETDAAQRRDWADSWTRRLHVVRPLALAITRNDPPKEN